jgi:Cupin-like domain
MATTQTVPACAIARRERPSYAEFVREHLLPRRPVILTGAMDEWPARSKWTPEYFKSRYGLMSLQAKYQQHTLPGFLPEDKTGKPLTFGEFIDLVESSDDQNPAPYLRNVWVEKFIPELMKDLYPLPTYFSPNWLDGPLTQPLHPRLHGGGLELYIGGKGGKFPVLHYDSWHIYTFLCQIYGTKEYTIFSPDQAKYLYMKDYHVSSLPDVDHVDLSKYPLYINATPIKFQLHAGEVLFVPAGWFHVAKIISPSITISASRVNSTNWDEFARELRECAPVFLKPFVWAYLTGFRTFRGLYGPDNLSKM